jgi:hypothetical protein
MNKTSMDALNRGWSIGFGTQLPSQNADFEHALSRNEVVVPEPTKGGSRVKLLAVVVSGAEAWLTTLGRRFAH